MPAPALDVMKSPRSLHPNGMNTSSAFALNATAALMMNPTSFSPAMRMEMTRCLCAIRVTGGCPPRDGGNFVR
jgi:hypothetical protein